MRIWSIHPKYLDVKGLVAVWRETLLAKKVLEDRTKGYKHHPQLLRFKQHQPNALLLINLYLYHIHNEAQNRGYRFDYSKLDQRINYSTQYLINVTTGQLEYELEHIKNKTKLRSPHWYEQIKHINNPEANQIFNEVEGPIELWEKL